MPTLIVIGGGAAGYFAAVNAARMWPAWEVVILEQSKQVLSKVKISGGGRCNVTHACFEPKELIKCYPRGSKALLGPFHRFMTGDTMGWFEERGVELKIEEDNRVFPTTDESQTIIDCLQREAQTYGVKVYTRTRVHRILPPQTDQVPWQVFTTNPERQTFVGQAVLVATGSNQGTWQLLAQLGHQISKPVPSLFTFNIQDPRIQDLPGLATEGMVQVPQTKLSEQGPILITHWGLSGPGILKLSAWGAHSLAERQYQFPVQVNWVKGLSEQVVSETLHKTRTQKGKKTIAAQPLFDLPQRLWRSLVQHAGIRSDRRWADLPKNQHAHLLNELTAGSYQVNGKSTFKDEFVTAGGVILDEVNFKTMASKRHPSLYFAGEVLNIDAITGGFNFQAAWTTGWIMAEGLGNL